MRVEAQAVVEYDGFRVEPMSGSIGAEVVGVDLRDVDDDLIAELRRAWLDYKVLFFRDQDLTQEQHVAYGRRFGELEVHPFIENDGSHPEIVVLESTPDQFLAAEFWHSDVTFRECPPMGSVLAARVLPPYGGDTCWSNMDLAYERLPDEIKEQIDGAHAIHSYEKVFGHGSKARAIDDAELERIRADYPPQKHPIVRTHPETGNRSLFVNNPFVVGIDGMDEAESGPLLKRPVLPGEGARVQLPLPVASRERRAVGQSLHPALLDSRLRRPPPPDGARHPARRPPGLNRRGKGWDVPILSRFDQVSRSRRSDVGDQRRRAASQPASGGIRAQRRGPSRAAGRSRRPGSATAPSATASPTARRPGRC